MIWLAWAAVSVGLGLITVFIGFLLLEGHGIEIILGIGGAIILILFFKSSAYLIKYYDHKKEPQKLECVR